MTKAMLAATIVLSFAAAPAFAGQATTASKAARSSGSADVDFVFDAAKGGMAEVQLGQLAADKASSDDVKKFGQRMVSDHSKANDELKALARDRNITLPTDVDAKDKATHDRLAKLSGAAFDRAYMRYMLNDHKKDVNEFKKESNSGRDSDVKAWASKTLPTLEEHLKMAEDTTRAVGTSGTMNSGKKTKGTSGR